MRETYSEKRYIMVCGGCRLMFDSARKDQLTCSNACRVRAHRSGSLKALRGLAQQFEVSPGQILQAAAVDLMGMGELVMNGALKFDGDQRVLAAFDKRVLQAAKYTKGGAA